MPNSLPSAVLMMMLEPMTDGRMLNEPTFVPIMNYELEQLQSFNDDKT